MKLSELLASRSFERSLLIGYYGGGNYGDELLLEVLANMLKQQGVQDITIAYQNPPHYPIFHRDFGYRLVEMNDKRRLIKAILDSDNIIIGGGGLWGLDMN